MFLAYVTLLVKGEQTVFAIIGKDESQILERSLKYGTDPTIVSELYCLGDDWRY